jgi:hypothetical protein
MLQTTLEDGRTFGWSFQDGTGKDVYKKDGFEARASEDYITLDGKAYKMDIQRLRFRKEDYHHEKKLYTILSKKNRQFSDRECHVDF